MGATVRAKLRTDAVTLTGLLFLTSANACYQLGRSGMLSVRIEMLS